LKSAEAEQIGGVEEARRQGATSKDLRITDLRVAVVASNYDYPIIRIDTNQGVYGIGEVRDAGHKENVLQFKNMLLGQNPCNMDLIYRAIKWYGSSSREGGGVAVPRR
jgi:L-alanine-DL-glutamate epimerase-like enolase superfamily enzyme